MEDKERTELDKLKRQANPRDKSNFLEAIFFCWTLPLFAKGLKKNLDEGDLYKPLRSHESKRVGDKLEAAWRMEENLHRNPSLWRALIRVFGKEFFIYGCIFFVLYFFIKLCQPIFVSKLMSYYVPNQTTMTKNDAFLYASLIPLDTFIDVLVIHSYYFGLECLGIKIRVACCSLIYRKALRLSKSALAETTVGQMVNLLSNDVNRFEYAVVHLHHLWVAPLQTIAIMYLLHLMVGPSALVGVAIFLPFIPLQLYLAKRSSIYRLRTALKTDGRVRLMNEIISGIQVIKMYTWEKPFAKLVEIARKLEIKPITSNSYIRAFNLSLGMFLTRTAIFLCVLTHVLVGHHLHAYYVFVVASFYALLRENLSIFLPISATFFAETVVSTRRIQKFMMYEEISRDDGAIAKDLKKPKNYQNGSTPMTIEAPNENAGIFMEEVSAKWVASSPENVLSNASFHVGPKQLVAVIGNVGSGKTTLLHVILKEINLLKGHLDVGGAISYASQEPWLFTGSIKQNILFGQEMDAKKYQEVVRVCALERDFSLFPYGDRTIVGERGTMLSGGQKARVNLARAIYKDADIYLLDDPLSAVDTHVGKQLFDDCISGYLKDKCTVLVTHQLQYLRTVDRIYLLENGNIAASGTYQELQKSGNQYLKLLQEEQEQDKEEDAIDVDEDKSPTKDNWELPEEIKEQRGTGTISKEVYKRYFLAGGSWKICFLLSSLFILAQSGASGVDYFLAFWTNLEQEKANQTLVDASRASEFDEIFFTSQNCIYLYSFLVVVVILLTLIRSASFFKFCMNASQNLHNSMFSKIVYGTMRFFNTNPTGRILNRFSKDVGSMDELLPLAMIDAIQIGINGVAIVVVIASVNVWILIPTTIILALFYCYRIVFLSTSRNLKRMEGTTRSPVFTHLTASLQGLTTIRAFGAEDILRREFDSQQDLHSSALFMFKSSCTTFGFWLDMNCVVFLALVTMSFLVIGSEIYGGNVGLAITQSMALMGMLQWGIRQWSELENQMTSVERVVEYTEVAPEPDQGSKQLPKHWPSQGQIEFQNVSLQYSKDDPFVLRGLNFRIDAGEKIGIVGRTGAGKTSLISALFRLAEIEGNILIDGVDTKQISLHGLRSKISIIPQEPVLFSGALRKNLDPFDEYEDSELWEALEKVELKSQIAELPAGLQSSVSEGGSNFSVGQRQLLCLARAVIRSNKILVLDEATANVDPQTDELIQTTIRDKFRDCTVLTIAHRLHTVMDSDKILVMDAGCVVEFGHPHLLLQDERGVLYGLVKETGTGMAENLTKIAQDSYNKEEVSSL